MGNKEQEKCLTLRRRLWIADVESIMKAKLTQQQRIAGQNLDATRERERRNLRIWRNERNS